MDEKILKKLQQRVDRRSFLRGSGLAAAALAGVTAFPFIASAQDPAKPEETKKEEKKEEKKDEKAEGKERRQERRQERRGEGREEGARIPSRSRKKTSRAATIASARSAATTCTKQDRTWTCENCGYSYTE